MPNKDKTGPKGKGPKTGRGLGQCEGARTAECDNQNFAGRRCRRPRRCGGQGLGREN